MGDMETNGEDTSMLFDEEEITPWRTHWKDMPEYALEDLSPRYSMIVNFYCEADVLAFGELIGQPLRIGESQQLPSVWHPSQDRLPEKSSGRRYIGMGVL